MSERDLKRIQVLTEVLAGQRTVASAAAVLSLGVRQTFRLLATYEEQGGSGLIHKARGRTSNRSRNEGVRKYAVELVKTRYADFGPTLATEVLLDKHELRVGRETLRRWMIAEGLWLSRTQRRTFHQPRLRRESYGELIQIDGSDHRWFEQRGEPCTLLVFIDGATSTLMQLRFVASESTASYFEALDCYLKTHGCPILASLTSTRRPRRGPATLTHAATDEPAAQVRTSQLPNWLPDHYAKLQAIAVL